MLDTLTAPCPPLARSDNCRGSTTLVRCWGRAAVLLTPSLALVRLTMGAGPNMMSSWCRGS